MSRIARVVVEDPEVVVELTAADWDAYDRGEIDPSVAYMQGRLKASGDPGAVLAFLRDSTS